MATNRSNSAIVWTHQTANGAMLIEGALPNVNMSDGPALIRRLAAEIERLEPIGNERLLRCAREAADQGTEIMDILADIHDVLAAIGERHGLLFGVKDDKVGFWREGGFRGL